MSSFAVDTAAVTHAASNVSRSISSIRADVHTLMRHLQELQNSWRVKRPPSFKQHQHNGTAPKHKLRCRSSRWGMH